MSKIAITTPNGATTQLAVATKRAPRLVTAPSAMERKFSIGSDVEVARATLEDLSAEFKGAPVVYSRGEFWMYEAPSGIWRRVDRFKMERIIHSYDGAHLGERSCIRVRQGLVSGALQRAAAIVADEAFFDTAAEGIAFQNAFVRVEPAGVVQVPHASEHRATVGLNIAFDPRAGCPRFLRALEEISRDDIDRTDRIALLQEFAGACLIGVATRYQVALMLIGAGANGKSVLLLIISALFPEAAVVSIPPQDLAQEYRRAMLAQGVRLNIVNELPEREVLDSEAFKSVVSGDLITGRKIREAPFAFRPTAGHIFAGNRLPGTADHSHGFFRRALPLPFTRIFEKHEQDPTLADTIIAQELPGVARWALDGAARLLRTGHYTLPLSAVEARERWRRDADQVSLFAEDSLKVAATASTSGKLLYERYDRWAKSNGHRPLASNRLAERLRALGFVVEHTRHGNYWLCTFKEVRA